MPAPTSYTFYFGGELFSAKHLYGNALLAEAIFTLSEGRYVAVLPQNLEQRDVTAQDVRDQDLRAVQACDLGLFHYDGPELDSGTVVEFLFAKFCDIPGVLLRSDFRNGGDQKDGEGDAWNLMSSFFPRTKVIQLDSMAYFQQALREVGGGGDPADQVLQEGRSGTAGRLMTERMAQQVIEAFDALVITKSIMPNELAPSVYQWLGMMPGLKGEESANVAASLKLLASKTAKGLL